MSIFEPTIQYRPFKQPKLMELAAEQSISLAWHEGQIDLSTDLQQFHTEGGLATKNVTHASNKNMLTKTLNLFTQMDVAAGECYAILVPHVKNNEARCWLMAAGAKEGIHQRAYALAVETLDFPESTWGEFMEYKEMQDKIDLMTNVDGRDHSNPMDFCKTLIQLLLAEGICLFGAFACMLNLKRYGLMQGTNTINEWSLRDEERHVEGNIIMLMSIMKDLSKAQRLELNRFMHMMVNAFVEAEHRYIDLVFEMGDQEGMTKQDMKDYITYLGQLRLMQLGLSDEPALVNPLSWMPFILSGEQHSNFFEKKETQYDHEGLVGEIDFDVYSDLLD